MPYSDWLKITDGTEQGERFPAGLGSGYFKADELSFADLLAMGATLAARLNFYNLQHEQEGHWGELFSDDTAIMAVILSMDLRRQEVEFLRHHAMSRDNLALARHLIRFAAMVDFWFRGLSAVDTAAAHALSWQIAAVVENKLAAELHTLGACCRLLQQGGKEKDDPLLARFHPIWQFGTGEGRLSFPRSAMDGPEGEAQIKKRLHAAFYALLNAVSFLKKEAERAIGETTPSRMHNPALGLFMAFLTLYRKAQDKINGFQERHLDFYYRDLLHLAPRPPEADAAYLLFDAAPGTGDILIATGTEFPAGRDDAGQEILFRADNDLVVTDLRVQSLRTLFFGRDRSISPERELGYVTRVHAREIPAGGGVESGSTAWPLFGAAGTDAGQPPGESAGLGFALATPVLLLREGVRNVDITLVFTRQSTSLSAATEAVAELCTIDTEEAFFAAFGRLFSRYLLAESELLSDSDKTAILGKAGKTVSAGSYELLAELLQQDRQDLFFTLLPGIFALDLTGEKGWLPVAGVTVGRIPAELRNTRNGLCFSFTLGPEIAPVVPYAPDLHGAGFATRLPVARFRINPQAHFSPLSLFDEIAIKEFVVEASVKGAGQLLAYNNHGQLDPTKPFQPFGPLPGGNSYLVLGAYEAALKPLTELTFAIEWGDLPKAREGFSEHYREYGLGYTNDSFTAELSVLRDGNWFPGAGAPGNTTLLFDRVATSDAIAPDRRLAVTALSYCKPLEPSLPEDAYRFDLRMRSGFFKLALTGPDTSFGHKEYPALLTATLSANARKKPKQQLPPPNPPYTPLINRISIDYTARTVIKAGISTLADTDDYADKPFYLHPFGIETIRAHGDRRFHRLLPQYHYDGNLFIGFTAGRPGGVATFFFHLREDSRRSTTGGHPWIAWFYLAANRWQRLGEARILSDTTNGFLATGIVTLDIPEDIDTEHTVMPDGLYWLRVAVDTDIDSFCSLWSVQSQAVKISRRIGSAGEGAVTRMIPAGTIREPKRTLPGITAIRQPLASFGGHGEEHLTRMKTRISERLRHKNRATMPWDYERLVLERFPEVFKVKCFATMQSDSDRPRPGSVQLVVVPQQKESARTDFDPMLSAAELNRIHDFVRGHTSPYVDVEVRNPVYERILVRCSVVLTKQAEAQRGYYLGQLNQAIVDYISPWRETGYKARFGWCIRQTDIESYLRQLAYVEFVTKFSMLHITGERSGDYSLGDTARLVAGETEDLPPGAGETMDVICPHHPWSLAIPVEEHAVETVSSVRSIDAEAIGIDKLRVGQTFIIGT